ncbi:Ig-like domain-containing protein [Marinobacter shengliensis]|uniref:Ig-like domain-containing protein n=1 Tax=Marinobacter shengliensis TaxID=1389223 RepID=UPI002572768A|nr:Ig-like domain-containing protein [Marinobacter shengliensis]BEH15815.1 lipase [Marinobacter shengliensis]
MKLQSSRLPVASIKGLLASSIAIMLAGCLSTGGEATSNDATGAGNGSDGQDGRAFSTVNVAFDPANQVLPFPTNLLFEADASAPKDGTINAPVADPEASSAALVQGLNELDGFSTIAPWRVAFTGDVDAASLLAGNTVRVFRMTTAANTYPERVQPTAVDRELVPETDYRVQYNAEARELLIVPTRALEKGTSYTAVITKGVLDPDGALVGSPLQWSIAKGTNLLDQCDSPDRSDPALLQCTTNPAIAPLVEDSRFGLSRDDLLLGWGVTTQQQDDTFLAAAQAIKDNQLSMPGNGSTTCQTAICFLTIGSLLGQDAPKAPGDKAIIYPGTIQLPSFIATPDNVDIWGNSPATDEVVLSTKWTCEAGSCNSDDARGLSNGGEAQMPQLTTWNTVPVVLAVPDPSASGVPARPAGGYPLVIFQHAIQQDRTNALAIASELARKGFAVIAIDMPLHGLVRNQLPTDDSRLALHAANLNDQLYNSSLNAARDIIPLKIERTYYLDLVGGDDDTSDGIIDGSGAHFLNPSQPLTQRDTLRQGGLDLVSLAHYIRSGQMSQCGMADALFGEAGLLKTCNASRFNINLFNHVNFDELHFLGHSVGNIVAAPFLAQDPDIRSVAMLTPTGGIMETLAASDTIGPQLASGLAESGVFPGTEDYFRFFAVVQAAIDSVDPLNHAQAIANPVDANGESFARPVYLSQVVGNDGSEASPSDLVLPPSVGQNAPLAGSTPLANAMGLEFVRQGNLNNGKVTPSTRSDGTTPQGLQIAVPFRFGAHSSPLLPDTLVDDPRSDEPDATVALPNGEEVHFEMQMQVADFFSTPSELTVIEEFIDVRL